MSHPLHKVIGDIFSPDVLPEYEILKDPACGGKQIIPLYSSKKKSKKTEYCNVDLLILKSNKIKVVIEIEEADIKPSQVCGKFLTSALTKYYFRKSDIEPVVMDDSVLFIQILDTVKLVKEKTSKINQWKNVEKSIQNIIPAKGSKIDEYKIYFGDESEFSADLGNKVIDYIKNYLNMI